MGTIKNGILGGFSGTVGTVVGGNWRGIDYMRSRAVRRKPYSPSQKQRDQNLKFRIATRFAKSLSGLLRFSFKDYAIKMTSRNSCVSYLLKNAITGSYPSFQIDYASVLISRGDLEGAINGLATSTDAGRIAFSWTNNDHSNNAKATDRAILVVHCPALNQSVYTTTGATRSAGTQVLDVVPLAGQEVHTYISFVSEDGTAIAPSTYAGVLTVA